jgi:DNA primase catalytic subunit
MQVSTSKKELKEFYINHPPALQSITDITKRHFRFLLPNGRFFKLKDTIYTSENLQKWLIKLSPLDVFYSTSTYLDPTSVTPRPTEENEYWGPVNIVLKNDIAFDLDRQPLSLLNLERARKDAERLYEFLKNKGYALKYIAFSGSKGFHLIFNDTDTTIEPNLRLREKTIIQKRKTLLERIKHLDVTVDTSVTKDTRRIIRVPGTINSKTGYCCSYVSLDELQTPVSQWIDRIPHLPTHQRIPTFKWRAHSRKRSTKKPPIKHDVHYGYSTYVSSSVLGVKSRHAILLSFSLSSQQKVLNLLKKAQETYHLTDIYLFKLPTQFQAICLKTVQRNRYQKILDYTQSSSAHQLRKYNRVSLRMGPIMNQHMQQLEPPAEFVTILECASDIRETTFVSYGHINFLKKHGLTPLDYQKTHGNGEFMIVDAELQL